MKIKDLIRYIPHSLPWLAVIAMGILLLLQHTDLLFRAQEQSLFLSTGKFFSDSIALPGGWVTYAAAYLTQFFYYPVLGVAILVVLWAATEWLLVKGTRLDPTKWGLAVLLPIALCSVIAQTGYSIFILSLQGLLMTPTLASFFVALLIFLTSRLRGIYQTIFIGVISLLSYPVLGAYGIMATILSAVYSLDYVKHSIIAIIGLFISCMVFYYTHTTVMMSQMIYAALPSLIASNKEAITVYYYPYIGIVVGFILPLLEKLNISDKIKTYSSYGLALLSVCLIFVCNFNNNNFRRELQISRAMENNDWYGVLDIVDENKGLFNPTREIVFARNVALWHIGKLGDYAFTYNMETVKSRAPFPLSMPQICASQEYYYAGLPLLSYRWSMETCVGYGWDVEGLKRMSKCSIISGEYELAKRYLDMLSKTTFHSDWAEHYMKIAQNPELIKEDKELSSARDMVRYANSLIAENGQTLDNIYTYYSNTDIAISSIQEFGILSAMMLRDHKAFWDRFLQYISLNLTMSSVPRYYQEAALLMASIDGNEKMINQPYSRDVVESFKRFTAVYNKYENLPKEQHSALMWKEFGRTYYYYYSLNREQ